MEELSKKILKQYSWNDFEFATETLNENICTYWNTVTSACFVVDLKFETTSSSSLCIHVSCQNVVMKTSAVCADTECLKGKKTSSQYLLFIHVSGKTAGWVHVPCRKTTISVQVTKWKKNCVVSMCDLWLFWWKMCYTTNILSRCTYYKRHIRLSINIFTVMPQLRPFGDTQNHCLRMQSSQPTASLALMCQTWS